MADSGRVSPNSANLGGGKSRADFTRNRSTLAKSSDGNQTRPNFGGSDQNWARLGGASLGNIYLRVDHFGPVFPTPGNRGSQNNGPEVRRVGGGGNIRPEPVSQGPDLDELRCQHSPPQRQNVPRTDGCQHLIFGRPVPARVRPESGQIPGDPPRYSGPCARPSF